MPGEPAVAATPAPGVWRLARLFFMQPIALDRLCESPGPKGTVTPLELWRRARAQDWVARALIARLVLLSFTVLPAMVVLVAVALTSLGFSAESQARAASLASIMAVSLTAGFAAGVARLRTSPLLGAVSLAFLAIAYRAVYTAAEGLAWAMTPGITSGAVLGAAGGALIGVALVVTRVRGSLVGGLVIGIAASVALGVASNVASGAAFGIAFVVALLRLPLWLTEAVVTGWLLWRIRRRPEAVPRLARWLPFRHHELIYLPLPGLRAGLIEIAEVDPELGQDLIAQAADSIAQGRIARLALVEIQARDLERAARDHRFERAASLDLPHLPRAGEVAAEPERSPLLPFQTAARDLIAGSANQRQRGLALERARSVLQSARVAAVGAIDAPPLARRLLPTTALWLEVIRDEDAKLRREAAEHPEVPPAFIAGPPLTPERAEDLTLFKGRSDIIKLIEHDLAPERRGILLVTGQRRMGKTSLCNYLPTYLGTGTAIVASNFQPLSGDAHRETPHRRVLGDIARAQATPEPPDSPRWGDGLGWLEDVDATCGGRKLLVVIDEVERVEDGIRDGWCSSDFLDFLRAAGDALRNIRFLLLTAYPLHRLGPHWTDRLVSVTSRTISYLGETDARELLTCPIPEFPDLIYPEAGVDRILAETGRHPYLLQKAGDDLCRLLNSRGGLRTATHGELTEVFDGMVRDIHLFDEIWRARTPEEQATLQRLALTGEPGRLDPAAIQLAREDYLVRRGDQVVIAVPLFREWIRMNIM